MWGPQHSAKLLSLCGKVNSTVLGIVQPFPRYTIVVCTVRLMYDGVCELYLLMHAIFHRHIETIIHIPSSSFILFFFFLFFGYPSCEWSHLHKHHHHPYLVKRQYIAFSRTTTKWCNRNTPIHSGHSHPFSYRNSGVDFRFDEFQWNFHVKRTLYNYEYENGCIEDCFYHNIC